MYRIWLFPLLCVLAVAQSTPAFEAASVRISQADTNELVQTAQGIRRPAYKPFRYTPGRITCSLPLVSIIARAYGLKIWQIAGPSWLYDGAYEIAATMPAATDREQAASMLRNLLADRFAMKSHSEMRDVAVYELTADRGAVRLAASSGADSTEFINNASDITAKNVSMLALADWLDNRVDRPVIDRTGLTGSYNIALKWSPEFTETNVGATDFGLIRAMEAELGLKLTAGKSSQAILVIDQARKIPTEN